MQEPGQSGEQLIVLYVSHREENVSVLGPGMRYVLWTQGCKKRCPGCVFPEGRPIGENGYWMETETIMREIINVQGLTGITVSGGEPFLQSEGLAELIKAVRERTALDVMLFSGYTLEELREKRDFSVDYVLNHSDLLVDGEYIEELNHNTIYRGSDNQRILFLSEKYKPFQHWIETTINRSLEFVYRNGELFMVGIPAKNFQHDFWRVMDEQRGM